MTTIKGLTRRVGLAAFAVAMLSLAAMSTPVQAQEVPRYECTFCEKALAATSTPAQAQETGLPFNAFGGFRGGVSVGVARGQTVRIVFRSTNDIPSLEPSEKPDVILAGTGVGGHVKAFNAATGALLWSRELTNLTAGLNIIDINRDELPEAGNSDTARVQLCIEMVLVGMKVSLANFEVFDNESGKTAVSGPMKESMETMKKAWKDAS
jgi:hypothetical protein